MLSQYIKKENCHKCQFCCRFNYNNLWDVPLFTNEEKEKWEKKYSSITFKKMKTLWTPTLIVEGEYFNCPFLNHDGCILGKNKPFDCAIWPFYVMKKEGNIVLAKCNDCQTINEVSKESLMLSMNVHILQIKDYIDKFPDYIKPHISAYEVFFTYK